ncbi:hypothetical protein [Seonamhaeicola maritimus]|uniref:hypothetical protein n=1 Tax=Seonamhaeicola maritimus TaxID=2591822 RepID=UPI0024958DD5|nr:hypothetical protein [Seonamhaeicola maritimus]
MKTLVKCLFVVPLFFLACQDNEIVSSPEEEVNSFKLDESALIKIDESILTKINSKSNYAKSTDVQRTLEDYVASINEALIDNGIQLSQIDLLGYEEAGITIRFKTVGNKQMAADWVPNDPRFFAPGPDLYYWTDGTELTTTSGMTDIETYTSINNAMQTWATVSCSEGLDLINAGRTDLPIDGTVWGDVGFAQWLRGFGGRPGLVPGTILHAGILPLEFFDAFSGGNGSGIIAVTFTWIFRGPNGLTDIDNNGKFDTVAREIYYNDAAPFQDAPNDVPGNGIIDFETVALHEAGHGLSQGHFGKAFTDNKGEVHFAPRAVMNSGAKGAQRELLGTDNAGHCSIWDGWPYE